MSSTGTGRIYRRGNVWWIDYSHRGKRHRESSHSQRKKDAQKLLRRRMAEIGRGRLIGPDAEKVTFKELGRTIVEDYKIRRLKSLKRLKGALKNLGRFFGDDRALDITTDRLRRYILSRREEGAADSTIRNEINALRRAFRLAVQADQLDRMPHFPTVKVDAVRTGFLTMKDVQKVCSFIGKDLAPVVRFAAITGWRKAEILGLSWSNVDFGAGVVRLEPGTTKNDEGREYPFADHPVLDRVIRSQHERTRNMERGGGEIIPWVFHRSGREIKSIRGKWKSAVKLAGLKGYVFHDLRRTAIRNMERAGLSRSAAMKLSGHKTESVYRRYAISDSVSLSEGVGKLARFHEETQGDRRSVVPIEEAKQA